MYDYEEVEPELDVFENEDEYVGLALRRGKAIRVAPLAKQIGLELAALWPKHS